MRTRNRIVTALAAVGVVAAAGSAFTATGVTTTGNAASPQFVGGTVSQAVTGATLNDIVYSFEDTTNTAVDGATLTFTDALADGRAVTAVANDGLASEADFACSAVSGTTSTCTLSPALAGLVSITITVASSQ